jgi:hypothetical protein
MALLCGLSQIKARGRARRSVRAMEAWIAGIVIAAVLALVVVSWRRLASRPAALQLWQAMEHRGVRPEGSAGEDHALAVAVRRCALCAGVEECEHWLAGGQSDPATFCPNHTYLENLERAKRRVTVKR